VPGTPGSGTYNFVTKVLTPPAGWSIAFPTGGVLTDPVYTSRATVSTSNQLSTNTVVSGWTTPVIAVQNGSDASVNMANLKTTIEANSGTEITLASGSTLFRTSTGLGGTFIGGGGIYGKNASGVVTFGINGATGAAAFSGDITGGATISISGDNTNSLSVYGLNGNLGSFSTSAAFNTSSTTNTMGVVGLSRVSSGLSIGVYGEAQSASNPESGGVMGIGYYGVYGYSRNNSGAGVLAKGFSTSGVALNVQNGNFISTAENFKIEQSGKTTFMNSTSITQCVDITGTYPILKFSRTGDNPWAFYHEAGNFTLRYGPTYLADFIFASGGNLTARGNITAYSDITIKTDIVPIKSALAKISKINGYRYKNLLADKYDCGIIAQEIEKILPELVTLSTTTFGDTPLKTVNYNGIVALLVSAVKELQSRVEALESNTI
jgi:hypothetical protein